MKTVLLQGTGIHASRLGFGTASLHHLIPASSRKALILTAVDAGFTHFDTAPLYGDGLAERSLGDALAGGLRQSVTLATKIGIPSNPLYERLPWLMYTQRGMAAFARGLRIKTNIDRRRELSPASAERSLRRSLLALRTDWLDILFVHEPQESDIPALQQLSEWMAKVRVDGRVRYLGLAGSAISCVVVARALAGLFDVLQVEDSLVGREADEIVRGGYPMQITYGYIRRQREHSVGPPPPPLDINATIQAALRRNPEGIVLVSTRKMHRLRQLAQLT